MKTHARRIIRSVAGLALAYALAALTVGGGMTWSWLRGRPLTSPLQIVDPGLTLLVPGEPLPSPLGGPALRVTEQMVQVAAGLALAFFVAAGLTWTAAGLGLAWCRRWARGLGLALFGMTLLVGLANLALEISLLAMLGGEAGAGGWTGLGASLAFTSGVLVLMPGGAMAGLLLPGVKEAFTDQGNGVEPRVSPLMAGLTAHFLLVAALLILGLAMPDATLPHRVLIGPWLLSGWPARLASALLGVAHLAAGVGYLRRRRPGYDLALWMNVLLTTLALLSAMTASDGRLEEWAGGLIPGPAMRWTVLLLGLLGVGLVISIRATRSAFRPAVTPVPSG
jgi:hypothetical protein